MAEQICIYCVISGKVQGVFFRDGAQKLAQELGITGWARNNDKKQVEILACGTEEALNKFKEWLWRGPRLAEVTGVYCEEVAFEQHARFVVL